MHNFELSEPVSRIINGGLPAICLKCSMILFIYKQAEFIYHHFSSREQMSFCQSIG